MNSQLQRLTAPENNLLEQVADARARIERLERYPDTLGTGNARDDESFVVIELSDYLSNERRLQAGDGLTLTDDGAGIYVVREMATHCQWDDVTFGESCTSMVTAAIPRAVEAVLAEL